MAHGMTAPGRPLGRSFYAVSEFLSFCRHVVKNVLDGNNGPARRRTAGGTIGRRLEGRGRALKKMPYKPAAVANSILYLAKQEGRTISPLKLQKLLYFLHGWSLAIRGEPIVGEKFEAWPYGPVLSSIYHEFKQYGAGPIEEYACDIDPVSGEETRSRVNSKNETFSQLLDRVWRKYSRFSAIDLSEMTHRPGSPWDLARRNGKTYLDDNEIAQYFKGLSNKTN